MSAVRRFIPRCAISVGTALLVSLGGHAQAAQGLFAQQQEFLAPELAFRLEPVQAQAGQAKLQWHIAPGYYLYREQFQVAAMPSGRALVSALPPGTLKNDPNFGVVEVYHENVALTVPTEGAEALRVTWQGCAEAGMCYPPQTQTVPLPESVSSITDSGPVSAPETEARPADTPPQASLANDSAVAQMLRDRSLAWTLPLFFVLGLALAFTPCVLPMLPIVSSLVLGGQASPRRALGLSAAFVLPMAATYAALGSIAALAGANLQALLQNQWTTLALGGLYGFLALGMLGLVTLQLPTALRERLDAASRRQQGGSPASAAALGVLSALLVGPCMTAPLAGTLLYIAQDGRPLQGALVLFVLGLGMGAPMVVASVLGARVLPRPGPWMDLVKGALGFALLATAIWTLERAFAGPAVLLLWGALLLGVAVTVWHRTAGPQGAVSGWSLVARTAALVAALWGSAMVLGAAAGASDPTQPLPLATAAQQAPAAVGFETVTSAEQLQSKLAAAKNQGKAVLVDYYADWCTSCKTLEHEVFTNEKVRQATAGWMLLKVDVTANDAPSQGLMKAHEVAGPPTVLLFDAKGVEQRAARLVGKFDAAELAQRLESLRR